MRPDPRAPVMADVARVAGVSAMTVSRVLSGYPGVRPETRARVQRAIEELDYQVHQAARRLAGGRSRSIGVVSMGPPLYGPSCTLSGIEAAARRAHHTVTVAILHRPGGSALRHALQTLRSAQVDGFIVVAPVRSALRALAAMDVPEPLVVLYGSRTTRWATVGADQAGGARSATRHLLELGHETVYHLRGPVGWVEAERREAGWRSELARWGARAPEPMVGDWSPAAGYEMGRRLARNPEVTSVFVANDQMAMGLLLGLVESGRSVPADMSVVGFDDTPESAYAIPPLTTVRQDFADLGRRAVESLVSTVEGRGPAETTGSRPQLVIRRSTAAPGRHTTV